MKYLAAPPIIEAILDIDCDMPPNFDISTRVDDASDCYQSRYPKRRKRYLHQHTVKHAGQKDPEIESATVSLQGVLFGTEDGKQLVQVRQNGYSFHRLAPYTRLDDYLPEMESAWDLFSARFQPIKVIRKKLRYINRLLLPLDANGTLDLDNYFTVGPRLTDDAALEFIGFLQQHQVIERETGLVGKLVLASERIAEGRLPVLFDIEVVDGTPAACQWSELTGSIASLRRLKNELFHRTLTDKCKQLYDKQ